MNRLIPIVIAVNFSCPTFAIADDYLLRFDTIGFVDKPAAEKDPEPTLLRSIEVLARPQSAFHSKVIIGTETIIVSGKLLPADGGRFTVQLRYSYSIDKGFTTPTEGGGRKPLPNTSVAQTIVTIAEGDSVTFGGLEGTESQLGKPTLKSKIRCNLVLTKYEPSDD